MTIGLSHYLALSTMLFMIGLCGIVFNRRNVIVILLAIELILLAANINFVAFSSFGSLIEGQVMAMIVLTVAAAETSVGLAILVVAFRQRLSVDVSDLAALKG
ncbi:MAG: NADH-quinone oxidoreductase subunit NuoK [Alphaproteobacteria bacterium]|nr:NADH-quinone oxidoreductase subunit NuoK [Alphaproteobacteria bacterium]